MTTHVRILVKNVLSDPRFLVQTHQCIRFWYCGDGSNEPAQCSGSLEPALLALMRPKAPFELYLTLCPVTKAQASLCKVQTRDSLSLLYYMANYRHLSQYFKHWYSALSSEYKKDQTRQSIRCSH